MVTFSVKYSFMATYVFGAGASLHAGYPLTADLGNGLYAWARQSDLIWRGYIEELYQQYGGLADLERILTELHERPAGSRAAEVTRTHCGNTLGGIKVAIPEYFHSLRQKSIEGRDLYRALAHRELRNGDTILTFNHDLACERALRTEGLWEVGDGYGFLLEPGITPPSNVKVLKLHGSTNWLGMLFGGNMGLSQVSSGAYGPRPTLFGGRDFSYLGYPDHVRDPHCKGISTTGGDPALILPTLHKNFFHQTSFGREWEPFWNYLWGEAARALTAAEKIVIIGYGMPAADERARELLLNHSNPHAEILVLSGSRSSALCEDFTKSGFRSVNSLGQGYFEDLLEG
jgi:hypothetical protein